MRFPRILIVLSTAAVVFGSACDDRRPREMRETGKSIPLQGAARAEASFRMSAGEMKLRGGADSDLMTATFRFDRPQWEPRIDHRVSGDVARLDVEQHRSGFVTGRVRNNWDIRLSDRIPMELNLNLGAGKGVIDLSTLNLTRLDINMGVGDMELDLSGPRTQNLIGRLKGGIGHATLYLPSDIGVRLRIEGGLGSVDAKGFIRDKRIYQNEAYGRTAVSIDLDIEAGIGSIDLRLKGARTSSF
jgi:hypothetical protein